MIASYAYIDAEVTEDNTISGGNRLFNAPEHSASLWTSYEIQDGNLERSPITLYRPHRRSVGIALLHDTYRVCTNRRVYCRNS